MEDDISIGPVSLGHVNFSEGYRIHSDHGGFWRCCYYETFNPSTLWDPLAVYIHNLQKLLGL